MLISCYEMIYMRNITKTLHFDGRLPELILKGKKTTTWRINDEKNIAVGDRLSLCSNDNVEFASAAVTSVRETSFGKLAKEDREGHEEFSSDEELYRTYSRYYGLKAGPETKLKIIKFRLSAVTP